MVNSSYTYSVFGMCAYTFAIGGMLVWVPLFLINTRGLEQGYVGRLLGLVTLAAAVLGMTLGGRVADRLSKTNPRALFLVPGLAMLASIPFVLVGLLRPLDAGDLPRHLPRRDPDVRQHRAVQRDHRQRRDARTCGRPPTPSRSSRSTSSATSGRPC